MASAAWKAKPGGKISCDFGMDRGETMKPSDFETWAADATDGIEEHVTGVRSELLPTLATWTFVGNRATASPVRDGTHVNFTINGSEPERFVLKEGGQSAGIQIAGKLIGP